MASFNRRIFDYGLYGLKSEATTVYLTYGTPSAFSQLLNTPANSGLRIGKYVAGAGNVFGTPYNSNGLNGRSIDLLAVTTGVVDYEGAANVYVVADDANQRILLSNALTSPINLRTNGGWTMNALTLQFLGWTAL